LKLVAAAKKLSHHFAGCPAFKPPQATRPSTSGGPVAFRPPITRGLALSRVILYGVFFFQKSTRKFSKNSKKSEYHQNILIQLSYRYFAKRTLAKFDMNGYNFNVI
jgi:hypothetical protein